MKSNSFDLFSFSWYNFIVLFSIIPYAMISKKIFTSRGVQTFECQWQCVCALSLLSMSSLLECILSLPCSGGSGCLGSVQTVFPEVRNVQSDNFTSCKHNIVRDAAEEEKSTKKHKLTPGLCTVVEYEPKQYYQHECKLNFLFFI